MAKDNSEINKTKKRKKTKNSDSKGGKIKGKAKKPGKEEIIASSPHKVPEEFNQFLANKNRLKRNY